MYANAPKRVLKKPDTHRAEIPRERDGVDVRVCIENGSNDYVDVFLNQMREKEKGKKMKRFERGPTWCVALLLFAFLPGCGDSILGSSGSGSSGSGGNSPGRAGVAPALGAAATFGTFGGSAGMTNTGALTQINNGDIGTTQTAPTGITGFHDSAGDVYTEVPVTNIGAVSGKIYTCTQSTTGPTAAAVNPTSRAIATQVLLDAQAAYQFLVAKPAGPDPGAGNLANLTLAPGVYTSASGSFMIQGGNLTLDAQGNPNAVWVFQMATTLRVGGPGATAPQSIILAGGAQAKNVFWQVGSAATINAAGGGTMVGTIISQAGAVISTAANTTIVTLNGRVQSLGASVTMVNTVINVPAP